MIDKSKVLSFLGKFPKRVLPQTHFLDSNDCGDFIRHTIEYSLEESETTKAFLNVPKSGKRPLSAIICHHQHAGNYDLGKSETAGLEGDKDQFIGDELARMGFVTLCADAIGFESRNLLGGAKTQYFELTQRLFRGETLLAKVLHDVFVEIDVLCGIDFVDAVRIGFIGHSYGGRMAIWAAALDERIKASVSNCGSISFAQSCMPETGIQAEFCVPNLLGNFEIWDVANLISPRAFRLQIAREDKWCRGSHQFVEQCERQFVKGAFEWHEYEGAHAFTTQMRNDAYEFLKRELS